MVRSRNGLEKYEQAKNLSEELSRKYINAIRAWRDAKDHRRYGSRRPGRCARRRRACHSRRPREVGEHQRTDPASTKVCATTSRATGSNPASPRTPGATNGDGTGAMPWLAINRAEQSVTVTRSEGSPPSPPRPARRPQPSGAHRIDACASAGPGRNTRASTAAVVDATSAQGRPAARAGRRLLVEHPRRRRERARSLNGMSSRVAWASAGGGSDADDRPPRPDASRKRHVTKRARRPREAPRPRWAPALGETCSCAPALPDTFSPGACPSPCHVDPAPRPVDGDAGCRCQTRRHRPAMNARPRLPPRPRRAARRPARPHRERSWRALPPPANDRRGHGAVFRAEAQPGGEAGGGEIIKPRYATSHG